MQQRNPTQHSLGIDVSAYQGIQDWNCIKESGISFVFIKSTEGFTFVDEKFKSNLQGAKSAGLKVGVYHFCRASDISSALHEADFFIDVIKSVGGFSVLDIAPVLDLETPEGATKDNVTAICKAWIERVKFASGMQPILYSYPSFADQYLDVSLADIPLWLANYSNDPIFQPMDHAGWTRWTFLQYSEEGKVPGIDGYVDMNEYMGNIQDYSWKIIVEDEDNMAMNLTEDQWQRLNNVIGQHYNAGIVTDWGWMEKIHSRTLTATEMAFLNCLIEAKKLGLSVEPNSYGMK